MADTPLISIVDDDAAVREAIESLIKSAGYKAHVFPSAQEFLGSAHVDDTRCLILDVQMAGMNGLELQKHLLNSRHRVPIIFISAHCDSEVQARALEAGAIGFLQKPFSDDALLDAIKSSLTASADGGHDRPDPDQSI